MLMQPLDMNLEYYLLRLVDFPELFWIEQSGGDETNGK